MHPCGFLSLEVLDGGAIADATALVGPSTRVTLPLGTSDEQGAEQPLDVEVAVLLVDFGASVLERLRDLGEDIVAEGIFPYHLHQPEATPLSDELLVAAKTWVSEAQADRAAFYSAVEDGPPELEPSPPKHKPKRVPPKKRVTTADLAAQLGQLAAVLPQLSEQLTSMKQRQESMEQVGPGLPMAKQTALTGPPPRTRPPADEAALQDSKGGGHWPSGCGGHAGDAFRSFPGGPATAEPGAYEPGVPPCLATGRRLRRPIRLRLFELCGLERRCEERAASSSTGCQKRGLLPVGPSSSCEASSAGLPGASLFRRLLRSGVDVPVPREIRGVCWAPGDRLRHVVFGSRDGLPVRPRHSRCPRVHCIDLCGSRPELARSRQVGFRMAPDTPGGAAGAAVPWEGNGCKSPLSSLLPPLSSELDDLCSSVLKRSGPHNHQTAGIAGPREAPKPKLRRGRRAGRSKAEKAAQVPKEGQDRRSEVICAPTGAKARSATQVPKVVENRPVWAQGPLGRFRSKTFFAGLPSSAVHGRACVAGPPVLRPRACSSGASLGPGGVPPRGAKVRLSTQVSEVVENRPVWAPRPPGHCNSKTRLTRASHSALHGRACAAVPLEPAARVLL